MMPEHTERRTVEVHAALQSKNETQAARNRALFQERGVVAINLLSSPGSGKTALLERTLTDLRDELRMAVIVGDLATDNDARRLQRSGAPALQITTGDVCHLDAAMIARAVTQIDLGNLDLLFIENVGNLVCPASYDLGEALRVVLLSVTEGEDKPLKYPTIFKDTDVALITKIDLAAAVEFDRELAWKNLRGVAPQAQIFEVSARSGEGLEAWYTYLRQMTTKREPQTAGSLR